jgi:hypothetical protein
VREHSIIPARLATTTAVLVVAFELAAGSSALAALLSGEIMARAVLLFAVCAAAGGAFAFYVRRLLLSPEGSITSCGCSLFAGPLTPVAIVPAIALLLMSGLGLAAAALGFARSLGVTYGLTGVSVTLPLLWGVTLALLIILLPASMPRPAAGGRW